MIRGVLLALLMVPASASALDLKLGLLQADHPLYENLYDHYTDDDGIIGRIELIQRFDVAKGASINVFATHLSLFGERDPHYGINAVGVELEFNFKLSNR